jgi:hypothetical protein
VTAPSNSASAPGNTGPWEWRPQVGNRPCDTDTHFAKTDVIALLTHDCDGGAERRHQLNTGTGNLLASISFFISEIIWHIDPVLGACEYKIMSTPDVNSSLLTLTSLGTG